ncbi:MAG: hypothetical protein QOJ58_4857, partial [Alphaproteobacteria bacterium]|nr:hypothetical protein [Alphaproteobacteria bacterium]
NAADGAGEEPDREDKEEIQRPCLPRIRAGGPHPENMTKNAANKIRGSAPIELNAHRALTAL